MLCVAQLLLQASVSAGDILDLQPGEPNGPFWIVSTADSRWPNKDFELLRPSGNSVNTEIMVRDHRKSKQAKYWLYTDKEASRSKRTSAWIVSTCESKYGGEGLFLKSNLPRVSTWKHEPAGPDRKMLWDLIPVDNDMRFYIVSNADSRAPNEMLFLNDPGGLSSWPFQEDRQAQWFLKRAPAPTSCYKESPWTIVIYIGIGLFFGVGPLFCVYWNNRPEEGIIAWTKSCLRSSIPTKSCLCETVAWTKTFSCVRRFFRSGDAAVGTAADNPEHTDTSAGSGHKSAMEAPDGSAFTPVVRATHDAEC